MDKLDPNSDRVNHEAGRADLARRLARYRGRVEAEGRHRSVQMIDSAIENVKGATAGPSGKPPKVSS